MEEQTALKLAQERHQSALLHVEGFGLDGSSSSSSNKRSESDNGGRDPASEEQDSHAGPSSVIEYIFGIEDESCGQTESEEDEDYPTKQAGGPVEEICCENSEFSEAQKEVSISGSDSALSTEFLSNENIRGPDRVSQPNLHRELSLPGAFRVSSRIFLETERENHFIDQNGIQQLHHGSDTTGRNISSGTYQWVVDRISVVPDAGEGREESNNVLTVDGVVVGSDDPAETKNEQGERIPCKRIGVLCGLGVTALIVIVAVMMSKNRNDYTSAKPPVDNSDNLVNVETWMDLLALCDVSSDSVRLAEETQSRLLKLRQRLEIVDVPTEVCSSQTLALLSLAELELLSSSETDLWTRFSLSTFFFETNGLQWKYRDGWISRKSVCSWLGVFCQNSTDQITKLSLPDNGLQGPIPEEFFSLTAITGLYLQHNNLRGNLAGYDFASLRQLQFLHLSTAPLSGTFPSWIAALTHLSELYIDNTDLRGSLPTELGVLASLERLTLRSRRITITGTIPSEIAKLTKLVSIQLRGHFTGVFPPEIWTLPELEAIEVTSVAGEPEGSFPTQIFEESPRFTNLVFRNTGLIGEIPTSIGKLNALEGLDLHQNFYLEGSIPTEIGLCTQLTALTLDRIGLTGALPQEIGQLSELIFLGFESNSLTGTIPDSFSRLTKLQQMSLFGQMGYDDRHSFAFSGIFPTGVCALPHLQLVLLTCESEAYQSCPEGCCDCLPWNEGA